MDLSSRLGIATALAVWASFLVEPVPVRAQPVTTLALLPFVNVSGKPEGARTIMPVLERALRDRGYRVVGPERLEPYLARNRVRDTAQLTRRQVAALEREFGAGLAVVGSVAIFSDAPTDPQWGLSARLLATRSGAIVWAQSVGLTGDDFTVALGLGTITAPERLAEKVVEALFRDLPRSGEAPEASPRARSFLERLLGGTASYRSPTLDSDRPKRVAVLPFENLSERKGAARIVTDVVVTALVRDGRFEVVDPGAVREALVTIGAAPYGVVTLAELTALRPRVEADAIILGSVFRYSEGLKRAATTAPEAAFDARMLDAADGRILWLAERTRNGDDSQIALHFGKIRAVVPLILRMANEMTGTL